MTRGRCMRRGLSRSRRIGRGLPGFRCGAIKRVLIRHAPVRSGVRFRGSAGGVLRVVRCVAVGVLRRRFLAGCVSVDAVVLRIVCRGVTAAVGSRVRIRPSGIRMGLRRRRARTILRPRIVGMLLDVCAVAIRPGLIRVFRPSRCAGLIMAVRS